MRILRLLLLLVLGIGALEVSLRMSGQSMQAELQAWMYGSGAIEQKRVDVAEARRLLSGEATQARRRLLRDLVQDPAAARQLVDELAAALEHGSSGDRRQIVVVLSALKKDARRAAPAIAKLARDPDTQLRLSAIRAVSGCAERPTALLPSGAEMIAGLDKYFNYNELHDMSRLDPELIETLMRAVAAATDRGAMHYVVASNVRHLGPRKPAFVAWWLQAVGRGKTAEERLDRASVAEQVGPDTRAWLEEYLDDPEPYVRLRAALSRMALDPKADNARDAQLVADYLPRWADGLPPEPAGTLKPERAGSSIDWAVLRALPALGPRAKTLGPVLARRLRTVREYEKGPVVSAMEEHGVLAENLPAVLEEMDRGARRGRDHFSWITTAAHACAKLGPKGDGAIPILVRCMEANDQFYRRSFVYALKEFGPRAREALPALRVMATSIDEWDARSARDAIAEIEKRAP